MSVKIYVEGGGAGAATVVRCRKGFSQFFAKLLPGKAKVTVVPCGGRSETYRDFCTSLKDAEEGEVSLLLVDSEEVVEPGTTPWVHLQERQGDRWQKPAGAGANDVHLMVQSVESWFLADPDELGDYYGKGFKAAKLPKPVNDRDVECHDKKRVLDGLNAAVKATKHKQYEKSHGFDIVGRLHPDKVCKVSGHAERLRNRLLEVVGDY